jgi:hypothetical protein
MSSTRTTENGMFHQERWASSPALDRPLKANLIAARTSVLESAEEREIILFLQYLSLHAGGLRWAASEVAPDYIAAVPEIQETWLASLCLNPASNWELKTLLPKLRQLMADYTRQKGEGVAVTEIGRAVYEALDYCSRSKCLVMISGRPRTGKTFAARQWVNQNPGRARYCEIPSSPDDLSFFTALARALGITVESNAKRKNLQPRIEAALLGSGLVLIADEAANAWPATNYRQQSRPARISWIMGMINAGASIAMIVTPNFFSNQRDYLEKSRWNDAQFYGRIERFISLPDSLPISDLEKVSRAWLPHGDRRSIEVLADFAALSQKHLAAIEHSVKQAAYLSKLDGRAKPEWIDIQRAIKTGAMPSETTLAAAIDRAAVRRKAPASVTR